VAASAASGNLDLAGTVTVSGSQYPMEDGHLDLPLVYGSLADAYNNSGISDNAAPQAGNFDGQGYSYSAQSLATVGLTPGRPVTHGPFGYTWPAAASGTPDNVVAGGQRIAVGKSGTQLGILGAASDGSGTGTGSITYTDGTRAQFTLALANWTPSAVLPADEVVATAPEWNRPANSGYPPNIPVSVYSTAIPLDASKTVDYITLPTSVSGDQPGTQLHLFDLDVP
jgi:hypothetical protein